ncbi:hypothetical protein BKA82DRAFT_4101246 [Pisolithus tinctorius]|uniref:Uncharacterized protein n=1 Tax=Pisolithus tinctorius Marx 270 TaxID=870435 RepID=A0A0C3NQ53_PISTI|nr:hypothetical protein BKA82DRAFT_4101246 [Pisolithus tinctorius]KIO03000.1 hypothetical protein M404DRAFT_1001622 [Pisolithus tinctorius Marx 270]
MAPCQFLPCEKSGRNRALSNKPLPPVPLNNKEKCSSPGGRCPLDISPPRLISSTNVLPDSWCCESTCNTGKRALAVVESFSHSPETSVPENSIVASHSPQAACTYSHTTVDQPCSPDDDPESRTKSPISNDDVSVYSAESAGTYLHLALLSPPNIPRIKLQRKATIKVAGSAVLRTRTAENRLKTYNKLSRHGSSARNDGRRGERADRESTTHSCGKENEGCDAIYDWDAPAQKSTLTPCVTRKRLLRTTVDPRCTNPSRSPSKAQGDCHGISKEASQDGVLCDITNMFVGTSTGAETMHRVHRPPSRSRRHRPRVPAEFLQTDGGASQTSGMVILSSQENARRHDNYNRTGSFRG